MLTKPELRYTCSGQLLTKSLLSGPSSGNQLKCEKGIMSEQEQFLEVIDRDEAELRFRAVLNLQPLGIEPIATRDSLGRVLATNVVAPVDVPAFDRSNFDGYAVQAGDTYGASELTPRTIRLLDCSIEAGSVPPVEIRPGQAMAIATGGMLPRGSDAILMVEHADEQGECLIVRRAVTPGYGVALRVPILHSVRRCCVAEPCLPVARLGYWLLGNRRGPSVAATTSDDLLDGQ